VARHFCSGEVGREARDKLPQLGYRRGWTRSHWCPSLYLVPNGGHSGDYMNRQWEYFTPVGYDVEQGGASQSVAEERGEAHAWWGEPLDGHKGSLSVG